MKTGIIIVSYNSQRHLAFCLQNLLANTDGPFEIIVVDNHSGDGSVAYLTSLNNPNIRVILNPTNVGYAKACNQGIQATDAQLLVTMNPDIVVPKGWLSRLSWHLRAHPNTLAVGPKGIGIGGRQAALPVSYPSKLEAADRKFAALYRRQSEVTKCLIGCLFLFDRRLIREIGYFDEQLPLGADDFDISLRIRKAGFEMRVALDVLVHHFVHVSFSNSDPKECSKLETASYQHFNHKWAKELSEYGWPRLMEDELPVFPHEVGFVK